VAIVAGLASAQLSRKPPQSATREKTSGGTMNRDTLLFRVSLIWLAILMAGCVYLLLTL
jgi:hypothetical protein